MLIEELQQSIKTINGISYIHNPLIVTPYYISDNEVDEIYNKQFIAKNKKCKELLIKKDFHQYIFLIERAYRLEAFINIHDELNDKTKAELLIEIWVDSEYPYVNIKAWKMLFKKYKNNKKLLMNEEELEVFNSLSDMITVYRGIQDKKYAHGISWTTNKSIAEFFANRFKKDGIILEKQILKNDCICFINRRGEDEIILLD